MSWAKARSAYLQRGAELKRGSRLPRSSPSGQSGLALIVLLTIISLGTAYLLVNQMNSISQTLGADSYTRDTLDQAKQALIGHAALSLSRPGALPCPDLHTPGHVNEGTQGDDSGDITCTTANRRVGRLPWKTIGLADLRDSSGERLWYAVSDNLRYDPGVRVLNSNTSGTLQVSDDVDGVAVASALVAVVIAPGPAISGQNRVAGGGGNLLVSNYLEGKNNYALDSGANNDDVFVRPRATTAFPQGQCLISAAASLCNDRILAISHEDLFNTVEAAVARRLETEPSSTLSVKQIIQNYRTAWGTYPYAVPFADPDGISDYLGSTGTRYGLLPVTANLANVTWETSSPAPLLSSTNGYLAPGSSCSSSSSTQLVCVVTFCGRTQSSPHGTGRVLLTVTARLNNVGNSFYTDQWDAGTNPMTISSGALSSATPATSVTHTLGSDGRDTVVYANARLPSQDCGNGATPNTVTRTLRLDRWGATVSASAPPYDLTTYQSDVKWFIDNEWHKLTYYALSPDTIPGSGTAGFPATCSANCLSLGITPTSTTTTNNVVLVLAGRAIGAQLRSTTAQRANLANYFESGNNQSTPDFAYERNLRSATFNDKVVEWIP